VRAGGQNLEELLKTGLVLVLGLGLVLVLVLGLVLGLGVWLISSEKGLESRWQE
jgi:hypothetical protein